MLEGLLIGIQLFFSCVVGVYFLIQLRNQTTTKSSIHTESSKRFEKIANMRRVSLTQPLSEKLRPKEEADIIGQAEGMKALKIALCGPNPQHVIIYGNPGIGKTAAARIALEIAKNSPGTPFARNAKFIEIDATTLRFDERSIADPLIGSVHDPIYQGAGAYGQAGVPQPKPGAVTKAHGGVLFIDEIGELHGVQMNKLLKVLEDRKVFLESAYYSESDENIPRDIHDIFKNGLPADFRLIGATTKRPEDIPPALRSRCMEIFFNNLSYEDVLAIVDRTVQREALDIEDKARELVGRYCENGRDTVNMLQTAYSLVTLEGRMTIKVKDIDWVVQAGHYNMRYIKKIDPTKSNVGKVNGLAVSGSGTGLLLEIEAAATKTDRERAGVKVTGIIEQEDLQMRNSIAKRKSMAANSVENVLTVLKMRYNINIDEYLLHVNFTSGFPVDGPSAGVAMFAVLYSAILNKPISEEIAMTGEISIRGLVAPVGGVYEKIMAAKDAGVKKVIIPKDNMQEAFKEVGIEVIPVGTVEEAMNHIFGESIIDTANRALHA